MIWQMFSFSIQIMPLKKLVKAKKAVFVKKIIILTYAISCFGKKKFSYCKSFPFSQKSKFQFSSKWYQ